MKDTIYIFGHKNPDTDSVCAAISLSYLYNKLGFNTEPRILSHINEETKYVLKKFKFNIPEVLNDVKLQISDVAYHKDFRINFKESIYHAFNKMMDNNMSTIPVVNNENKFLGVFAMKDIAKQQITNNVSKLCTKYEFILDVINGKETLKFDDQINGIITDNNYLLNHESILVVDDDSSTALDALNKKIKLLIICYDNKLSDEHLKIAKDNRINIIYTKMTTYDALQKLIFSSFIENYHYHSDIICVNESLEIDELNDIITKTKHSYYPVIDNNNICLGLIKLSDLSDSTPKKVILVDHNELNQSVDGLEEAEIVSIVDQHKLGNLGTNTPINFRNMTVGSTCTIIYHLYKENKIKIPLNIASLLLAGLISDTLLLKSPTTTKDDEKVFNELVKLTNIDAENFAINMFKANDAANSKNIKEIIYTDYKTFNIDNKTITISQITTLNAKAILKQKNSYIRFLNKECKSKNNTLMLLLITDIFKNGSDILFNTEALDIIKNAFGSNIEQGSFLEGIVSRKKQVLPAIISHIK